MDGQKKQAFTLVELIVVITILAILGTIAFISLQGYSTQARDSTRISDLSSMKSSLELFHLDAGSYPQPTDGVNITYSGATVWNQGTFGETVFANVSRLDKIPTDPLNDKEYTYSVTSTKNQYQLGGMVEGDDVSLGKLTSANAGTTEATAYITGNYNEQMTKALSGTICNVLAVPTIIVNDTTITNLEQIVASGSLVYRGFKNLPASFKDSKFKSDGGFAFTPNNLVAYTDTSSCEPITDTTNYSARVNLLKGLQDAYSGTIVQNEGELKNIMALTINTSSPSSEVVSYAGNYVNNVLKGKVSTGGGTPTVTYSNCGSGALNSYNYGAIIHNQTEAVTKTGSLTNGVLNYGADALCTNGVITIQNELTNIACNSGYVEQAGACVQDICGSTVPANAHSTATSQTVAQSWTYNTTPGACTFVCDNNYTWNGSSCIANTQNTACTGLPSNAVWNTASSITQTWSGTNWLPTESGDYNTLASTTECRYQCASNYTWNGSTCVANTQSVSCGGSVPANATATTATSYTQTWNGSAWSPTTSWGENQASCDFNCNSGYSWNGSSCVSQWSGDATNGYTFVNTSLVTQYPTSCNNLLSGTTFKVTGGSSPWNGTKFSDGVYWIKPDSNPAYKVYCEMTTDGGGWLLVAKNTGSSNLNITGAVGVVTDSYYKFASTDIDTKLASSTYWLIRGKQSGKGVKIKTSLTTANAYSKLGSVIVGNGTPGCDYVYWDATNYINLDGVGAVCWAYPISSTWYDMRPDGFSPGSNGVDIYLR